MRKFSHLFAWVLAAGFAVTAQASVIPFFYTSLSSPDVFSAAYSTTTNSISSTTAIGFSTQGADGVLIGPNSTLFYSGENSDGVFQITQTGTGTPVFATATTPSYLMALSGNTLYTFNNIGNVATLPITGGVLQNGTTHTITGPVTNVSNIVFNGSTAYYITGAPGATGSLGVFNTSTFSTSAPLFTGLLTAQDAVYDPYTGLIILFGEGEVDTFNPTTDTLGTAVTLPGATAGATCPSGTDQFDAGAVNGAGQAMVAGCGNLYYIDYSGTGNILSLSDVRQEVAGLDGKDIALFPTTVTPEVSPAGLLVFGLGLLAIGRSRRKRSV